MIERSKKIIAKPKLRYGIVAYIDFLGAKNIISNNENNDSYQDDFLCDILDIYKESLDTLKMHALYSEFKIKYRIFSDNIVICSEINNKMDADKKRNIIGEILGFVGHFQGMALERKYKTRGAITYGKFYINETLVWGKALIDDVNLEENVAIYPRVLIDRNLIEYLYEDILDIEYEDIKKDDIDGLYYNDFVWFFKDESNKVNYIREWLLKENNDMKDLKIVAKNNWIINKLKKDK